MNKIEDDGFSLFYTTLVNKCVGLCLPSWIFYVKIAFTFRSITSDISALVCFHQNRFETQTSLSLIAPNSTKLHSKVPLLYKPKGTKQQNLNFKSCRSALITNIFPFLFRQPLTSISSVNHCSWYFDRLYICVLSPLCNL